MNSIIFLVASLLCGLIKAQDEIKVEATFEVPELNLVKELDALQEKLGAMEARLTNSESRLNNCESRLSNSESRLRTTETKLELSQNQIRDLSNRGRTTVVFSAVAGKGDRALGPFDTATTLVYTKVLTNIGDAYSSSTGVFVAPLTGVYYFCIFFHAGGEHEAKLFLYKNSDLIIKTNDHQSVNDTADNGGNAVFLKLQQGDRIYVQMAARTHIWASDYHTTFSGFLVTEQ